MHFSYYWLTTLDTNDMWCLVYQLKIICFGFKENIIYTTIFCFTISLYIYIKCSLQSYQSLKFILLYPCAYFHLVLITVNYSQLGINCSWGEVPRIWHEVRRGTPAESSYKRGAIEPTINTTFSQRGHFNELIFSAWNDSEVTITIMSQKVFG